MVNLVCQAVLSGTEEQREKCQSGNLRSKRIVYPEEKWSESEEFLAGVGKGAGGGISAVSKAQLVVRPSASH